MNPIQAGEDRGTGRSAKVTRISGERNLFCLFSWNVISSRSEAARGAREIGHSLRPWNNLDTAYSWSHQAPDTVVTLLVKVDRHLVSALQDDERRASIYSFIDHANGQV